MADLRSSRHLGAWLFILLIFLAGVERRLAEVALEDLPSESGLLSVDTLEGEEMTVRLVAVVESDVQTVDGPSLLVEVLAPSGTGRLLSFAVRGSSPRAPPTHVLETTTSRSLLTRDAPPRRERAWGKETSAPGHVWDLWNPAASIGVASGSPASGAYGSSAGAPRA